MPARVFTITELQRTVAGSYEATPVRFEWTVTERNVPRSPWTFAIKQRTARTDYPGADVPTEQVLGPAYQPFTVQGTWDDRFMGRGRAIVTQRAIEDLVKRGPLVRVAFETLSVDGIITDVVFDYRRSWQIGYQLTVSPHYRAVGPGTGTTVRTIAPQALKSPQELAALAQAASDAAAALQAQAPTLRLSTDLATRLGDTLAKWANKAAEIATTIDQRYLGGAGSLAVTAVDYAKQSVEALSRLTQSFATLRSYGQETLNELVEARSDLDVDYATAIAVLDFDAWTRGLATQARLLVLQSDAAAQELASRVDTGALAVYRPQAGESLYGISLRFYGTPHHWRDIMTRNGLTSMTLAGTELLIIPVLAAA